jgi:hypothetical protein
MTTSAPGKQVLAVIPAGAGGRAVGAQLASLFGTGFSVTVVETTDEDAAALGPCHLDRPRARYS